VKVEKKRSGKAMAAPTDIFRALLDPNEAIYIDERYRVLKSLGQGSFANVVLCADEKRRGRLVAIKAVSALSLTHQQALMHEFVSARRLRHPNLVSMLATGVCARFGIYLVLEYVDGPSLVELIDSMDHLAPDLAADICAQIARGLTHMHKRGVVHRDVKADNVFLEESRVRLGDFGASRAAGQGRATIMYTPGYCPPETNLGSVDIATDAYSLGALFHLVVTGGLPPARSARARRADLSPLLRRRAGARAEALALRLLAPSADERLTDMRVITRRFSAMVRPRSRKSLRSLVQRANQLRDRATLESRWADFETQHRKHFSPFGIKFICVRCSGPVSEAMRSCPWCGDGLRFRGDASFPRYCNRCEHGIHDSWGHCAWCHQPFPGASGDKRKHGDRRYTERCQRCAGPMIPFSSACPWCEENYSWTLPGFSQHCPSCEFSVDPEIFGWCPWCGDELNHKFTQEAEERVRLLQRVNRAKAAARKR